MTYYIDENGQKFSPRYEQYMEDGVIKLKEIATSEEVYMEWLRNKTTPPIKAPTEQQILNAKILQDNAEIQLELEQQKQLNAQMLLQIANLGGNANV